MYFSIQISKKKKFIQKKKKEKEKKEEKIVISILAHYLCLDFVMHIMKWLVWCYKQLSFLLFLNKS